MLVRQTIVGRSYFLQISLNVALLCLELMHQDILDAFSELNESSLNFFAPKHGTRPEYFILLESLRYRKLPLKFLAHQADGHQLKVLLDLLGADLAASIWTMSLTK